jgi:hypothetical protein
MLPSALSKTSAPSRQWMPTGVALAAIQGLNQKLEEQLKARDAEIEQLKHVVTELKQLLKAERSE